MLQAGLNRGRGGFAGVWLRPSPGLDAFFHTSGSPGVELAQRRARQVHQQLRQVPLRVDPVPLAGARQGRQDRRRLAAPLIAHEQERLPSHRNPLHLLLGQIVVQPDRRVGRERRQRPPLVQHVADRPGHRMPGQKAVLPGQQSLVQLIQHRHALVLTQGQMLRRRQPLARPLDGEQPADQVQGRARDGRGERLGVHKLPPRVSPATSLHDPLAHADPLVAAVGIRLQNPMVVLQEPCRTIPRPTDRKVKDVVRMIVIASVDPDPGPLGLAGGPASAGPCHRSR
jgi:hypothetical protein